MDADHIRARVFAQWGNSEDDLEWAVRSCPVEPRFFFRLWAAFEKEFKQTHVERLLAFFPPSSCFFGGHRRGLA